jgi:hypothetical protein
LSGEDVDRDQAALGKIAYAFERGGDVCGLCYPLPDPKAFIVYKEEGPILTDRAAE